MKWRIHTIGKSSLPYVRDGVAEYRKRLRRYASVELLSAGKEAGREKNSARLLEASEGSFRIALDERGAGFTTREFAGAVEQWRLDGQKRVALLVGGAEGHSEELRQRSDLVLGLSSFTLQHELALLVFMEQIYRVHTLLAGEPYHRE